ncbi:MAG: DUF2752 domain-containing protein [Candidatus Marinimicrobia bacterium]|nr:DUF2752 domain-containing protein [Candidatus Neomarinimicrobiota bacterium]
MTSCLGCGGTRMLAVLLTGKMTFHSSIGI